MIKAALLTCIALLIGFLTVGVAMAGKKEKATQKDETILGAVACDAVAPKPPPIIPGPNGVPQPPDATQPTPGAPVLPPPPSTVRDCIAQGGRVVFHPDVGRTDLVIENPDLVRGHEWHRVSITGYPNGNFFHLVSLRAI
jgi:hypothetical protein